MDKAKYVSTDTYIAHLVTDNAGKYVFLVTNRRIIMAKQSGIMGNWETEWEHPLGDILSDPVIEMDGLKVVVRRKEGEVHTGGVAKLFSGLRVNRSATGERVRVVPVRSHSQATVRPLPSFIFLLFFTYCLFYPKAVSEDLICCNFEYEGLLQIM